MAATRLQKLFFQIDLINNASGGLNKLLGQLDAIQARARQGMVGLATGAAGLFGVGYAMARILGPAVEMSRALGEVRSLSVTEKALGHLQRRALAFSIQYGESAAQFTQDSYKIQSAIQGLQGNDLGSITFSAGVLAKGTKADFESINAYTGQMFNIFQDKVAQMGKANFMADLVDKTALAVQKFNTDGVQMVEAMKNIGNVGERMGIRMEEQIVIMGTLQNTMQMGARAGTAYTAFLTSMGNAQQVLNLQLTDTAGNALPIIDVLERIKGKYGDLQTVAAQADLTKAFGSRGMKMVLALSGNIKQLKGNIADLMDADKYGGKAAAMAAAITDPWQRARQMVKAVAIVFGQVLNPMLQPALASFTESGATLVDWLGKYKNVARVLGAATLALAGLITAVSLFAIVGGIAHLVVAGFTGVMMIGAGITKLWEAAIWLASVRARALQATTILASAGCYLMSTALKAGAFAARLWAAGVGLAKAVLWAFKVATLTTSLHLFTMGAAFKASAIGNWLLNSALLACPITWIVLAVVALIAGLVLLVKNWDAVSAAVQKFAGGAITWLVQKWQWLRGQFADSTFLKIAFFPLYAGMEIANFVFTAIGAGIGWVLNHWDALKAAFTNNAFFQLALLPLTAGAALVDVLLAAFEKIPQWWAQFSAWLKNLNPFAGMTKGLDWIMEKAGMKTPGPNLKTISTQPLNLNQLPAAANAGANVIGLPQAPAAAPVVQAPAAEIIAMPQAQAPAPVVQAPAAEIIAMPQAPAAAPVVQAPAAEIIAMPQAQVAASVVQAPAADIIAMPQVQAAAPVVQAPTMPLQVNNIIQLPRNNAEPLSQKLEQQRQGINLAAGKNPEGQPAQGGGNLMQQISNATTHNSQGAHIEKLVVVSPEPVDGYNLSDEIAMAGG